MNSVSMSNAINDAVVVVSDAFLYWVPQNEVGLVDQACTAGATYTMNAADTSAHTMNYFLFVGGVQTSNLNVGSITSATCSD